MAKSSDGGYLLVSIKTIDDEPVVVAFACPNGQCPDIIVNDQIEVDGKQGGDLPEQKDRKSVV